jgi:CRP-like cAMP-binding protein
MDNGNEPAHVKLTLTREEIAEMIGTTPETVSRLFSDFTKKVVIAIEWIDPDHSQ